MWRKLVGKDGDTVETHIPSYITTQAGCVCTAPCVTVQHFIVSAVLLHLALLWTPHVGQWIKFGSLDTAKA